MTHALSPKPEVVVYGTVALDRLWPVGATEWWEVPGGEALNTAFQLAGWGVEVALVGTAIGSDPEGKRLRALIDAAGISRAHIPDHPTAVTPVCEIYIAEDGERQMRGRGFAQAVAPEAPESLFAHQPLVALDPNLGVGALQAARRAIGHTCPLIAMDCAHLPEIARAATILQYSLESLRRFGPVQERAPITILTEGSQGGVVTEGTNTWRYPAFPLESPVDTTGAGDAFRAGLCYGFLQHWSIKRIALFASAAAACHCRRWGGASQVPLEEIQTLLAKNKQVIS